MIEIRLATVEDFEVYYKIKCQKSDITWTGPFACAPNRDVLMKSFLGRIDSTAEKQLFMIDDGGTIKGYVVFTINNDEVELGYSVYEPYQRQGVGKAAMKLAVEKALEIRSQVFAQIRDDNIPSQKCCMSVGFKRTESSYEVDYPTIGKSQFRKYIIKKEDRV